MTLLLILISSLILAVIVSVTVVENINSKPIEYQERFVDMSLDISEQLNYLIEKNNIDKKEFCRKLNISENTLLSWYSGMYDFKLSQIARIETVLNEIIIATPMIKRKKCKIV